MRSTKSWWRSALILTAAALAGCAPEPCDCAGARIAGYAYGKADALIQLHGGPDALTYNSDDPPPTPTPVFSWSPSIPASLDRIICGDGLTCEMVGGTLVIRVATPTPAPCLTVDKVRPADVGARVVCDCPPGAPCGCWWETMP